MTQSGQVSPDGMWVWDGNQWVPSERQHVAPGPPQSVEMVSPPEASAMVFGQANVDRRTAKAAAKQQAATDREAARGQAAAAADVKAFQDSPVGRARASFDRGDPVFQYSIDVMSQEAIIVAMVGSATRQKTSDPSEVLNAVCREGWDLVNGSFVFVEEGQESRDKFMASGQNVAIKGTTYGYYLFKRNGEMRLG